ncbi:DNA topoisomerase (ATP-hydrolyzing) subunit B [Candidatus Margulisiibacteriota bacterium]
MGHYDASTIKVLEGLEAVRRRPAMYIGTTDIGGLHHLIYEVVDNSVDEALAGYCTEMTVNLGKDDIVTITDNGRGIPIDLHKQKGVPAVEVVLTTLHAGGKFDTGGYKVSGGLHGVGVSCVNALSEWFTVDVYRDDIHYHQRFERGGKPQKPVKEPYSGDKQGTIITYLPDNTIFDTIIHNSDTISHYLREMAYLNKGLKIIFIDERQEDIIKEEYCYEGGISAYVSHINEKKDSLYAKPIYIIKEKDDVQVEVSLQHCKDYYDEHVITFANNIRTKEGGTHLSGFRSALTRVMNNFGRKYELLKKGESLSGEDIREGLTAIVSVRLPNPQFEGQTKAKLGNGEIKGIVDSAVDEALMHFLERDVSVGKLIVNKGLSAMRVRQAARKAQDLARRKSALESTTLPGKLADCTSQEAAKCEVYIVEGDSAGGSAKQGRDREFQAILPLRGKILNVEKARLDKILANEEIRNMITAIGPETIANLSTEPVEADDSSEIEVESISKKLRYHKVIIMTDADVDGSHIRTLLLTFFYRHARALVEAGHIYIAQPPLYLVKIGSKKQYAYNDEELQKLISEKSENDKVSLQRYKGLGEMNPDQLWETTMNPETRTMMQVTIDDAEMADEIFTTLMGDKVEPRRDFIIKYAKNVRWLDI